MTITTLSTDPFGDDEILRAVMAAVEQLDPAKQHDLLKGLQRDLQLGDLADNSRPSKVQRAIAALVEAASLVEEEGPLSRDRYLELRAATTERKREWPDAHSLTRWLGASKWNDALRRARLEAAPDGDMVVRQLGPRYKLDELTAALCECAAEIGVPPSFDAYISWAKRPEVRARPGRRPGSQQPFTRHGGFRKVLEKAGLIRMGDGSASAATPDTGVIRTAGYFLEEDELHAGLHEVAERLGHPPRVNEYIAERQKIYEETLAQGHPRAIPAYNTTRFRSGEHRSSEPREGAAAGWKDGRAPSRRTGT